MIFIVLLQSKATLNNQTALRECILPPTLLSCLTEWPKNENDYPGAIWSKFINNIWDIFLDVQIIMKMHIQTMMI